MKMERRKLRHGSVTADVSQDPCRTTPCGLKVDLKRILVGTLRARRHIYWLIAKPSGVGWGDLHRGVLRVHDCDQAKVGKRTLAHGGPLATELIGAGIVNPRCGALAYEKPLGNGVALV